MLFRAAAHAGWGILLLAFAISFGAVVAFITQVVYHPDWMWGLLFFASLAVWHHGRGDRRLLAHLNLPLRPLLWGEYAVSALPAWVLLAGGQNWGGMAILALGIAVLPFWTPALHSVKSAATNWKLGWIPLWAFEWRAGIRKTGHVFWMLWLGGLAASWWVGGLPLTAFFWGLIILSFYEDVETKEILAAAFGHQNELIIKMLRHIALAIVLLLPHLVLFLLFNSRLWHLPLLAFSFVAALTGFSVVNKYAGWYPLRQQVRQSLLLGLYVATLLSALFSLAAFAWWFWKTLQARRRMVFFGGA